MAYDSHNISYLIFFLKKLGKMSQNFSSAAGHSELGLGLVGRLLLAIRLGFALGFLGLTQPLVPRGTIKLLKVNTEIYLFSIIDMHVENSLSE